MILRFKLKPKLLDISSIFLFLLIISINIREPLFHSREILFALVIITSLSHLDIRQAKYAVALVAIWFVSATYNLLIPGSNFTLNLSGLNTIVIAGYLLLLCFFQERYAETVIKSYLLVSGIVAIITLVIWLLCYSSEGTYYFLRNYFIELQGRTGLTFINIDRRAILGTRYLTVWYRTSPCMICALGYCLIERLKGTGRHTVFIVLFTVTLVFSGTRANMLAAVFLVLLYIAFWFSKKKLALIKMILVCASLFAAFIAASKFLNDATSASSMIKVSDVATYQNIYRSDILRTLFFGWGPGSTFYSVGRGLTVDATELTLFETIRRYGIISTLVIFFYIWFQPLYLIISRDGVKYKLFYVAVLFAFIVIACTNPYLLDSVGFCALLFFCIYFKYGGLTDIRQMY